MATTNINTTLEAVFSFADFSALLTLFGDEATKQFLATSLSTLDTVLLGIAPLGIMTIIVSAIRVGGSPLMKSVIGRARDSPDDEEKEILSSTSSNVREIWDGNRVVRQTGEAKTIPLVYNSKDRSLSTLWDRQGSFITPSSALSRMVLHIQRQGKRRLSHGISKGIPPNLTLNTPRGIPRKRTVSFLIVTGLLVQAAVVMVNAFAVYRWQWAKSGKPIEKYAYPLWAAGTGAITLGVWLCGWVVESSSEKMLFDEDELRIIFMQQKLPAQNIPAYAIEPIPIGKKMMYSRRLWPPTSDHKPSSHEYSVRVTCVAIGTLLTLFGFVGQNIGTRGLHWSAGLLQLGATAVLTILRAVICRNVGDLSSPKRGLVDDKSTNIIEELESGFEACHLSTGLVGFEAYLAFASIRILQPLKESSKNKQFYTIYGIGENEIWHGNGDGDNYKTILSNILQAQILLTQHVPEVKYVKKAAANCLKVMDEILELILQGHNIDVWKDLGAFLCVALNDLGTEAAASTKAENGETFPKFRLIAAPVLRDERLQLLQAVISSTRYTRRKMWRPRSAFRILGHCAPGDVEARRQQAILSAWLEPHHNPQESSRIHINQPLTTTETGAGIRDRYPGHWEKKAFLFGMPLSHGFWNAIHENERPQEQRAGTVTSQLLWRYREFDVSDTNGFLVSQIALDILSSFMLGLASRPKCRSGFGKYKFKEDELCESLEEIIERNGICQQGQHARLAFVPALVSCGILNEPPGHSSANHSDMAQLRIETSP